MTMLSERDVVKEFELGNATAVTYFGDVWISYTRSRLSGVEESSILLGFDEPTWALGEFRTWFFREITKSAGLGALKRHGAWLLRFWGCGWVTLLRRPPALATSWSHWSRAILG